VVSLYPVYFVTINGLTNPAIWWAATVAFTVVVHAVLFRLVLTKN
jgi:hypothetical protein